MSDLAFGAAILTGALFVGLAIAIKEACKDNKVEVLYGYPAYRKTWLTIYHHRKSDRWVFEWDDLFDSGRPQSWGDISACLMRSSSSEKATKDEINRAWAMLRKRGLA